MGIETWICFERGDHTTYISVFRIDWMSWSIVVSVSMDTSTTPGSSTYGHAHPSQMPTWREG